jgi:hypothetical protein
VVISDSTIDRLVNRTHFYEHVPVSILVEDVRVHELEFGHLSAPVPALLPELLVGELGLGVLVQELHVRVRWCRVEVVVHLFDVFTVVSCWRWSVVSTRMCNRPTFTTVETEHSLLEDLVFSVP